MRKYTGCPQVTGNEKIYRVPSDSEKIYRVSSDSEKIYRVFSGHGK